MKLHGQTLTGRNVETIVIPRGNGPNIVFRAAAVLDDAPFDKLCPTPEAPAKIKPGGVKEYNYMDAGYRKQCEQYGQKKLAWTIIESLRATEGLEWDTVKFEDHNTWLDWKKELLAAEFSYVEIKRIQDGALRANCLDDSLLKEATESFHLGQAEAAAK